MIKFERFDTKKHDHNAIKNLLALAIGNPTADRLQTMIDDITISKTHHLFVALEDSVICGTISVDFTERPEGYVSSLAVHPDYRFQGIGRKLLWESAHMLGTNTIFLSTDEEAVDFYRTCGFTITEIDSPYPDHRRFNCVKKLTES